MREEVALGPGKAELLRRVKESGSISGAARQMQMSYMRAWELIQTMNECFREPVVTTERGGSKGGGARLTTCGADALRLYEEMERESLRSCRRHANEFHRLLRD